MTKKVALPPKRKRISRARNNMTETDKKNAEILKKYPDLLKKIEEKMKTAELDPWVKEFGGMINTGKNEDVKSR
ncbi:MAG: hypothetical protein M3015_04690 [Bacteroidota bacterium]|nr:hypothetical protein [Bacteroidota bacterium]